MSEYLVGVDLAEGKDASIMQVVDPKGRVMSVYEVVEAKTPEGALKESKWHPGDRAVCSMVGIIANSDGTYTVLPEFVKEELCHVQANA